MADFFVLRFLHVGAVRQLDTKDMADYPSEYKPTAAIPLAKDVAHLSNFSRLIAVLIGTTKQDVGWCLPCITLPARAPQETSARVLDLVS